MKSSRSSNSSSFNNTSSAASASVALAAAASFLGKSNSSGVVPVGLDGYNFSSGAKERNSTSVAVKNEYRRSASAKLAGSGSARGRGDAGYGGKTSSATRRSATARKKGPTTTAVPTIKTTIGSLGSKGQFFPVNFTKEVLAKTNRSTLPTNKEEWNRAFSRPNDSIDIYAKNFVDPSTGRPEVKFLRPYYHTTRFAIDGVKTSGLNISKVIKDPFDAFPKDSGDYVSNYPYGDKKFLTGGGVHTGLVVRNSTISDTDFSFAYENGSPVVYGNHVERFRDGTKLYSDGLKFVEVKSSNVSDSTFNCTSFSALDSKFGGLVEIAARDLKARNSSFEDLSIGTLDGHSDIGQRSHLAFQDVKVNDIHVDNMFDILEVLGSRSEIKDIAVPYSRYPSGVVTIADNAIVESISGDSPIDGLHLHNLDFDDVGGRSMTVNPSPGSVFINRCRGLNLTMNSTNLESRRFSSLFVASSTLNCLTPLTPSFVQDSIRLDNVGGSITVGLAPVMFLSQIKPGSLTVNTSANSIIEGLTVSKAAFETYPKNSVLRTKYFTFEDVPMNVPADKMPTVEVFGELHIKPSDDIRLRIKSDGKGTVVLGSAVRVRLAPGASIVVDPSHVEIRTNDPSLRFKFESRSRVGGFLVGNLTGGLVRVGEGSVPSVGAAVGRSEGAVFAPDAVYMISASKPRKAKGGYQPLPDNFEKLNTASVLITRGTYGEARFPLSLQNLNESVKNLYLKSFSKSEGDRENFAIDSNRTYDIFAADHASVVPIGVASGVVPNVTANTLFLSHHAGASLVNFLPKTKDSLAILLGLDDNELAHVSKDYKNAIFGLDTVPLEEFDPDREYTHYTNLPQNATFDNLCVVGMKGTVLEQTSGGSLYQRVGSENSKEFFVNHSGGEVGTLFLTGDEDKYSILANPDSKGGTLHVKTLVVDHDAVVHIGDGVVVDKICYINPDQPISEPDFHPVIEGSSVEPEFIPADDPFYSTIAPILTLGKLGREIENLDKIIHPDITSYFYAIDPLSKEFRSLVAARDGVDFDRVTDRPFEDSTKGLSSSGVSKVSGVSTTGYSSSVPYGSSVGTSSSASYDYVYGNTTADLSTDFTADFSAPGSSRAESSSGYSTSFADRFGNSTSFDGDLRNDSIHNDSGSRNRTTSADGGISDGAKIAIGVGAALAVGGGVVGGVFAAKEARRRRRGLAHGGGVEDGEDIEMASTTSSRAPLYRGGSGDISMSGSAAASSRASLMSESRFIERFGTEAEEDSERWSGVDLLLSPSELADSEEGLAKDTRGRSNRLTKGKFKSGSSFVR